MALTKTPIELSSTPSIVDGGNATAITIDSSENVGINCSNPSTKFVVQHTDGASGLEFSMGSTLNYFQSYNRNTSDYVALKIDAEDLRFGTNDGSERMRIASNGSVLISNTGGSFHSSVLPLIVGSGSGDEGMAIYSGSSNKGKIGFADAATDDSGSYRGYLQYDHSGDNLNIGTAGSEKIRIDSSGNLSIGNTSPASRLHVSGNMQVNTTTADGNENRFKVIPGGSGDNCTVQIIQDDASTVGVYLQADGASWFTGGINPGSGDTTAANVLDDYEEGTATLTLSATTTAPTITQGNTFTINYTKIGNLVRFVGYTSVRNVTNAGTGIVKVTGLPFAQAGSYYGHVTFTHSTLFSGDAPVGYIENGNTYFYPVLMSSTSGVSYGTGQKYMMCQGVYHTA